MSEPPPRELEGDRAPDPAPVPVRERADGYVRNGVWVPRGTEPDPSPPGWREQLESRLGVRLDDRRLWVAAAGVLLAVVVVVAIAHRGAPTTRAPQQERDFLRAVKHGQDAVRHGNDLTLVTAARDRASAVCAILPPGGGVKDWIGTLSKVDTVLGSKQGEVAVKLTDDVTLKTWSRESEDTKDHTLVDPNSDIYRALADLKSGEKVRFSGAFVPHADSCLHETSVFARNGMLTPGFVFRFTAVAPR